ncbi:MAG: hypothetical protein HY518_01305 [Candidatus Aenigmarchaeota archaeon]|nr:hypothetical protein [Candidatus Aenigmarchaeota archaeon]
MVLEQIIGLISQVQDNTYLLIALIVVFVIIAYKVFQTMIRITVTGILFALIPIAGKAAGFDIAVTYQNILWFAFIGILFYFIYSTISSVAKVLGFVSKPFRKEKVKTVVIKEKEKKKGEEDK